MIKNAHTTADEMNFIDGLGRYSAEGQTAGREAVLYRYLAAVALRSDWTGLNKEKIVAYVVEAISREFGATAMGSTVNGM